MYTHIALLRGINVSGHKKLKMADLKVSCEELGYTQVTTYIQSGNIVFNALEKDTTAIEENMERMIAYEYGYDVTAIVLRPEELKIVIGENPHIKDKTKEEKKCYTVFLKEMPKDEHIQKLQSYDYAPEEYELKNKVIYYYAANGMGNAKMNNNFFENKLKVSATTRNWKTVNKLQEIADSLKAIF